MSNDSLVDCIEWSQGSYSVGEFMSQGDHLPPVIVLVKSTGAQNKSTIRLTDNMTLSAGQILRIGSVIPAQQRAVVEVAPHHLRLNLPVDCPIKFDIPQRKKKNVKLKKIGSHSSKYALPLTVEASNRYNEYFGKVAAFTTSDAKRRATKMQIQQIREERFLQVNTIDKGAVNPLVTFLSEALPIQLVIAVGCHDDVQSNGGQSMWEEVRKLYQLTPTASNLKPNNKKKPSKEKQIFVVPGLYVMNEGRVNNNSQPNPEIHSAPEEAIVLSSDEVEWSPEVAGRPTGSAGTAGENEAEAAAGAGDSTATTKPSSESVDETSEANENLPNGPSSSSSAASPSKILASPSPHHNIIEEEEEEEEEEVNRGVITNGASHDKATDIRDGGGEGGGGEGGGGEVIEDNGTKSTQREEEEEASHDEATERHRHKQTALQNDERTIEDGELRGRERVSTDTNERTNGGADDGHLEDFNPSHFDGDDAPDSHRIVRDEKTGNEIDRRDSHNSECFEDEWHGPMPSPRQTPKGSEANDIDDDIVTEMSLGSTGVFLVELMPQRRVADQEGYNAANDGDLDSDGKRGPPSANETQRRPPFNAPNRSQVTVTRGGRTGNSPPSAGSSASPDASGSGEKTPTDDDLRLKQQRTPLSPPARSGPSGGAKTVVELSGSGQNGPGTDFVNIRRENSIIKRIILNDNDNAVCKITSIRPYEGDRNVSTSSLATSPNVQRTASFGEHWAPMQANASSTLPRTLVRSSAQPSALYPARAPPQVIHLELQPYSNDSFLTVRRTHDTSGVTVHHHHQQQQQHSATYCITRDSKALEKIRSAGTMQWNDSWNNHGMDGGPHLPFTTTHVTTSQFHRPQIEYSTEGNSRSHRPFVITLAAAERSVGPRTPTEWHQRAPDPRRANGVHHGPTNHESQEPDRDRTTADDDGVAIGIHEGREQKHGRRNKYVEQSHVTETRASQGNGVVKRAHSTSRGSDEIDGPAPPQQPSSLELAQQRYRTLEPAAVRAPRAERSSNHVIKQETRPSGVADGPRAKADRLPLPHDAGTATAALGPSLMRSHPQLPQNGPFQTNRDAELKKRRTQERNPSQNLPLPSPRSPKEGRSPISPKEGRSRVSPKEVRSPISPKEVRSPVSPKEVRSPVSPKEVRSPVRPKEVRSPISPKEVRSPISPREGPRHQNLPQRNPVSPKDGTRVAKNRDPAQEIADQRSKTLQRPNVNGFAADGSKSEPFYFSFDSVEPEEGRVRQTNGHETREADAGGRLKSHSGADVRPEKARAHRSTVAGGRKPADEAKVRTASNENVVNGKKTKERIHRSSEGKPSPSAEEKQKEPRRDGKTPNANGDLRGGGQLLSSDPRFKDTHKKSKRQDDRKYVEAIENDPLPAARSHSPRQRIAKEKASPGTRENTDHLSPPMTKLETANNSGDARANGGLRNGSSSSPSRTRAGRKRRPREIAADSELIYPVDNTVRETIRSLDSYLKEQDPDAQSVASSQFTTEHHELMTIHPQRPELTNF